MLCCLSRGLATVRSNKWVLSLRDKTNNLKQTKTNVQIMRGDWLMVHLLQVHVYVGSQSTACRVYCVDFSTLMNLCMYVQRNASTIALKCFVRLLLTIATDL